MHAENIGLYLKSLRQERKLTQKELADSIGVTHQAVSRWENGRSIPDIGTLGILSSFYNVPVDEILGRRIAKEEKPSFFNKHARKFGILLIFMNTGIILNFYLFLNHYITQVVLYSFLVTVHILILIFLKKAYRYVLLIGGSILIIFTIYALSTKFVYYSLDEIPRFLQTEEVNIEFGYDGEMRLITAEVNGESGFVGYHDYDTSFYAYRLSDQLSEMEQKVSLDYHEIETMVVLYGDVYIGTNKHENGLNHFKVLKVDSSLTGYDVIFESENPYRVFSTGHSVLLVSQYDIEGQFDILELNLDDVFVPYNTNEVIDYAIYDLEFDSFGYVVSACDEGVCNVLRLSNSLSMLGYYFDDFANPVELTKGTDGIVAIFDDHIAVIQNEEFYTIENDDNVMYHNMSSTYDLINGLPYQNGKKTRDTLFHDEDFRQSGTTYAYLMEEGSGLIGITNNQLVKAECYITEATDIYIESNIRIGTLLIPFASIISACLILFKKNK